MPILPDPELVQQSSFELVTSTRKELIKVKGSPFQVQGPTRLDRPSIEEWCAKHQTLDLLSEARTEAAPAWEDA